MNRRYFIKCAAAISCCTAVEVCNGDDIASAPNILLIVSDDQGLELGCYGDKKARTPNIDKLAKEGVVFNNAYCTQASCSPSRGSILTGLYPHQNGQMGLTDAGFNVKESADFFPAILQQADYYTGIIGKIHVKPEERIGFEWKWVDPKRTRFIEEVKAKFSSFLKESQKKKWFMMLNYSEPHRPHFNYIRKTGISNYNQVDGYPESVQDANDVNPLDFMGLDSENIRQDVAGYYNSVARLDSGVGMIINALKESGQYDNTTIIYTSDQGPGFTRSKTTCYEAGVRVPLIIKYPGKNNGMTQRIDKLVSLVDLFPTILDVAVVENSNHCGVSLKNTEAIDRKYLFTEFTQHGGGQYFPRRSVRDQRYKLIVNFEDVNPIKFITGCVLAEEVSKDKYKGTNIREVYNRLIEPPRIELYDLKNDPWEFDNLADKNPQKVEELKTVLFKWMKETDDSLLKTDMN